MWGNAAIQALIFAARMPKKYLSAISPGDSEESRMARKAPAGKTAGRVHLHIENNAALGPVFEASNQRVAAALRRHPKLAGKLRITIGGDGDISARAMRTADVLFGWDFDRSRLTEMAPRLRWIHAHGAGVNHLMPLDWLPEGVT